MNEGEYYSESLWVIYSSTRCASFKAEDFVWKPQDAHIFIQVAKIPDFSFQPYDTLLSPHEASNMSPSSVINLTAVYKLRTETFYFSFSIKIGPPMVIYSQNNNKLRDPFFDVILISGILYFKISAFRVSGFRVSFIPVP